MVRVLPTAARPTLMERVPRDVRTLAWSRVRAAHPRLNDDAQAFFAWCAARCPKADLARRQIVDLYLAWGCDRGESEALAALERDVMPVVARALASFADRGDLVQRLRERMLVEKHGRRGIAAYDGRAPLAVWLRVCATRMGLREQERERRSVAIGDTELDRLAPGVPDPALEHLKRVYGASFREAFSYAVSQLATRDRNLLRLSVLDGLGIDQLAAIFHIHRATAARQLQQVRTQLVAATRDRMRIALAIRESELESIMRLIHGLTAITLEDALAR
jgi:RNA polymerase sigma-70 factor (ECF subfamily)